MEKLIRLKALLAQGMTISQAATEVGAGVALPAAAGELPRLQQQLGEALRQFDSARASLLLAEALDLTTVEQVLLRVVRPLLPELKPFGRTYLRLRLGAMLLHGPATAGAPVALVACPDPSDLRPLLAAVLASRRGYHVIYVEGSDLPEGLKPALVIDPRRWADGTPPEQLFQ